MHITEFLMRVDEAAARLSKDALAAFIHNEARQLPEVRRTVFLQSLEACSAQKTPSADPLPQDLAKRAERIKEKLSGFDDPDRYLVGEFNEEYDDWYNDEVPMILYEDPYHLMDDVQEAIRILRELLDWERFREAFEIADLLLHLTVNGEGDYDHEDLSLGTLFEYELLTGDLRSVQLDALYAAYMAHGPQDRASALYAFFRLAQSSGLELEDLMQHAQRELPDVPAFLPLWIDYLGTQTGAAAQRLIQEAFDGIADQQTLRTYAVKFSRTHPGLYRKLLTDSADREPGEQLSLGQEALANIPEDYVIRSEIALLTAHAASATDAADAFDDCLLEAFRSDPSAVNYLRLANGSHGTEWRATADHVISGLHAPSADAYRSYLPAVNSEDELRRRNCTVFDYYGILFLHGDYDTVLNKGMRVKSPLGWSKTFLKCGIALFLLLLDRSSGTGSGCAAMRRLAMHPLSFTAESYKHGLRATEGTDDDALFMKLFRQTTDRTPLSQEQQEAILGKIGSLIDLRVKAIVSQQKRNQYEESAAFLAAWGEVFESRGEPDGKQCILTIYRNQFPRHYAFTAALKSYGWRKE